MKNISMLQIKGSLVDIALGWWYIVQERSEIDYGIDTKVFRWIGASGTAKKKKYLTMDDLESATRGRQKHYGRVNP